MSKSNQPISRFRYSAHFLSSVDLCYNRSVAFFTALLLLSFPAFACYQDTGDGNLKYGSVESGGIRLDIGSVDLFSCNEEVYIELNDLWCGTVYNLNLSLRNSGSSKIVIEKVTSSCGCFSGVSESNEIEIGGSVKQRVSMITGNSTEFSQQLEFRSSSFVGVKKLKFLAKCRPRATFDPTKLKTLDGKAQTIFCVPAIGAGSVSIVRVGAKTPNYIEVLSNSEPTKSGSVSFVVKPVEEVIGSRLGFTQLFMVDFVQDGKSSSSIIPFEVQGSSLTRVSPNSLKFVQRGGDRFSALVVVSRGEDLSEMSWNEFPEAENSVRMQNSKDGDEALELDFVVKSRNSKTMVLNLIFKEYGIPKSPSDVRVCLRVGDKDLCLPIFLIGKE